MKNFEPVIINQILKTIKKHQVYLTKKENLPQLAKLGYMYNTLWYAGRVCWGYDGVLGEGSQCEDNPKYKIEMCEPKTKKIDNYIYDAWGMHITMNESPISWDEFKTIVKVGKRLTKLEIDLRRENKTFDEWVDVLTHPDYRYKSIYPNRKSVASHLLCSYGNGYGEKNGYVISEASGADMDEAEYGEWENAIFSPEIQKVVDNIMDNPIVEITMNAYHNYIVKCNKEREEADPLLKFIELMKDNPSLLGKVKSEHLKRENQYKPYYPLCEYSLITKIDKGWHISYIKAAKDICLEILNNKNKEPKSNVKFANKNIELFNQLLLEKQDGKQN